MPKEITKTLGKQAGESRGPSWLFIFEHWDLVILDLHEVFGADWDDPSLVRNWMWWKSRIAGLLSTESRLGRVYSLEHQ